MLYYKSDELTEKEMYKYLTGSIIPRPIAWITTHNTNGLVNIAPFSFFNVVSNRLPLISISILRKDKVMKDTARNLIDNKEAVVHIVTKDLLIDVNETSRPLPEDQSETELIKSTLTTSKLISVPAIKEAKVRFETKLYQYVEVKDENDEVITDLFILKVIAFHMDESVIDQTKGYILENKLKPVSRLSGSKYNTLGKAISIVRPK